MELIVTQLGFDRVNSVHLYKTKFATEIILST